MIIKLLKVLKDKFNVQKCILLGEDTAVAPKFGEVVVVVVDDGDPTPVEAKAAEAAAA